MPDNEVTLIKSRQQAWATRSGRAFNSNGYCSSPDDNVFQGFSAEARAELTKGSGSELGDPTKHEILGKFHALHSSSALAYNWFDYWRNRDHAPLSKALGLPAPFLTLQLEKQLPTGRRGAAANLDVLLTTAEGSLIGIESKFAEPYTSSLNKTALKPQYFEDDQTLWTEAGLPHCQEIAESLRVGVHRFKVLDVAQLLKHMLALGRTGQRWQLLCLWFEVPGSISEMHRGELKDFSRLLGEDAAHFRSLTYQDLFERLQAVTGAEHAEYVEYLRDRYIDL